MSAKQDRVAPRTAADIESKYNFGKTFGEVMGLAQDAQKAAEDAKKAASEAAVGTNLLTGTKDFSGDNWVNRWEWSADGEYKGLSVLTRTGSWRGIRQYISVNVGETYTISAYVKSSGDFHFHHNMGGDGTGGASPENKHYETLSEWTRISDTFTITVAGTIVPGYESVADNTQLWICGMKLEKGDRATEWTPAPTDTVITHESVFNALTDNGKMQGVYRGDDGQIYINASYIKAGELLADLITTGTFKSKDGTVQINLNNNTVTISGTRTAYVYGIGNKAFKTQLVLSSSGLKGYGENTQGVMEEVLSISMGVGGLPTGIWNESWEENTGMSFGSTHGVMSIGESTAATEIHGAYISIGGKEVSWRDNGDGTYTLIGT